MPSHHQVALAKMPLGDGRAGTVGVMNESSLSEGAEVLRDRLARDGYLLCRDVIPRDAVLAGQRRITSELEQAGWQFEDREGLLVADEFPRPAAWSAHTGSTVGAKLSNQALMHTPEVLRVLEGEEIFGLFREIFGEDASTLDMKWLRAMTPAGDAPVTGDIHLDHVYMGNGSPSLTTAWVPWCDVPIDLGGLVVLEGSHRLPGFAQLRATLGSTDADLTEYAGHTLADPHELSALDTGARWVTALEFNMGDLVCFTLQTLHTGIRNDSGSSLRLSADVRFQQKSEPRDPRWVSDSPDGVGVPRDSAEEIAHEASRPRPRPLAEARQLWGLGASGSSGRGASL
jgi:ectoine hydroxylase-related dioxygenase (phytanoyl-CoA dioxygenase family)